MRLPIANTSQKTAPAKSVNSCRERISERRSGIKLPVADTRNGRIIIVAGRCNSSRPPRMNVSDILEYDPKSDAWRVLATIPLRLMAPSADIIGQQLVVIAGGLGGPLPLTAEAYVAPLPK
jgi:N-acetylneuraminic acid mutarotase